MISKIFSSKIYLEFMGYLLMSIILFFLVLFCPSVTDVCKDKVINLGNLTQSFYIYNVEGIGMISVTQDFKEKLVENTIKFFRPSHVLMGSTILSSFTEYVKEKLELGEEKVSRLTEFLCADNSLVENLIDIYALHNILLSEDGSLLENLIDRDDLHRSLHDSNCRIS